jgi:SAM-dependent methyltransferase
MTHEVELNATETLEERFGELRRLARFQADTELPQNNDPITEAYEVAFASYLDRNPAFQDVFVGILRDDPELEPFILLRKAHKTFQYLERLNLPTTAQGWQQVMEKVLSDEDYIPSFYGNIYLPIMSNVSDRGVLLKAVAALHNKTKKLSVLELGCGTNDILMRLELESDPAHREAMKYHRVGVASGDAHLYHELPEDERATKQFNKWLGGKTIELTNSLGMDVMPYDRSKSYQRKALSDSYYMGQIAAGEMDKRPRELTPIHSKNIRFISDDAVTYDPEALGQKFDITFLSTWLYQAKGEAGRALQNADRSTKDDGLIIAQDFIRYFGENGEPVFYNRWPSWTYGVWVKDMQQPDLGFQQYFAVRSGRADVIVPQPAVLRLPTAQRAGLAPHLPSQRTAS